MGLRDIVNEVRDDIHDLANPTVKPSKGMYILIGLTLLAIAYFMGIIGNWKGSKQRRRTRRSSRRSRRSSRRRRVGRMGRRRAYR